eukprot:5968388-Ditylum_brightwellii.AAC.1
MTTLQMAKIFDNSDNDDEEKIDPERKRMEMVRMIQKTFYQSPSSVQSVNDTNAEKTNDDDDDDDMEQQQQQQQDNIHSKLDPSTGAMHNLPLWRVNWVETPGRANCLNVHELQYTHMFETILSNPQPWYFGHLYTPGGSKGIQKGTCDLKSWRDKVRIDDDDDDDGEREEDDKEEEDESKVIGTLLRITDFRRLEDGRLMILVHGLERFVVDTIKQDVPYATADVQILPDIDITSSFLLPPKHKKDENTIRQKEQEWKQARRNAIFHSFYYHEYENKRMELPLPAD